MPITRVQKNFRSVLSTVCFTVILLGMSASVWAQVQNWWVLQATGPAERGKLAELKTRKSVYVDIEFDRPGPGQITSATEQADIRKNVMDALKAYKGITVVTGPERADFTIVLRTKLAVPESETERRGNFSVVLDQDEEVSVEMTVLVPGAKLPDGTFKSRAVWESFSPNVQMGALSGSRFVVDGFLWELKKIRDAK